jgi:glutathione S-transferase
MIIVHHLNESRSQRILWLLEELELAYEIRSYLRDPHTNQAPLTLRNVHPLGRSPIITDEGFVIAESGAIIDYLIRRHGKGQMQPDPASSDYDNYVHWMHYAEASAAVPFTMQPIAAGFGKFAAPLARRVASEMDLHLGYIDANLEGRDYLVGDALSGADIQLSFVGEMAGTFANRTAYPHLNAWVRRFQARPAYLAALKRGGPYKFGPSVQT